MKVIFSWKPDKARKNKKFQKKCKVFELYEGFFNYLNLKT